MTYEERLAALGAAQRFGVRLDLAPMRAALVRLGSPETRLPRVVHVGGTNGKGSTAAMIEAGLRAAGMRTGLYTSPHLARFTERIRLDGAEVDYVNSLMGGGFTIRNPNAVASCSCGHSFDTGGNAETSHGCGCGH